MKEDFSSSLEGASVPDGLVIWGHWEGWVAKCVCMSVMKSQL